MLQLHRLLAGGGPAFSEAEGPICVPQCCYHEHILQQPISTSCNIPYQHPVTAHINIL